jgi:hypothetical protein
MADQGGDLLPFTYQNARPTGRSAIVRGVKPTLPAGLTAILVSQIPRMNPVGAVREPPLP